MLSELSHIELFAATLSTLGNVCVPSTEAVYVCAKEERSKRGGIDAMLGYLQETQNMYNRVFDPKYPPVTPVATVPARLTHITCAKDTIFKWSPGIFHIHNMNGGWRYENWNSFFDRDDTITPSQMIRFIILWKQSTKDLLNTLNEDGYGDLCEEAINGFKQTSPQWADRLGF